MVQQVDVVVVGGGATGTGVARDLAMRGLDVTLVERGHPGAGTTGSSHGLLHSGARYVTDDPAGARECISENRVLREIAGACIADTGGYVVQLSADPDGQFDRVLAGCADCDIPTAEFDGDELRGVEPVVASDVRRAIRVPDAVVYPSRLVAANAMDARRLGGRIHTNTAVVDLAVESGRVAGVAVERESGRTRISARHVVNAAGPWAGTVAAMAGVDVPMKPTKGIMAVFEHPGLGSVLNRCRPPADGDVVVPHGDRVVVGTTSVEVADPDRAAVTDWEMERMVLQGRRLVPDLDRSRLVRSYAGVRPLHAPQERDDGRAISRGFAVLDHADRDGIDGLTTVVGGKLTTYRLMAEAVADRVCEDLGVPAPCRTADEPLPGADDPAELDRYVREFGRAGPADADVVGAK